MWVIIECHHFGYQAANFSYLAIATLHLRQQEGPQQQPLEHPILQPQRNLLQQQLLLTEASLPVTSPQMEQVPRSA